MRRCVQLLREHTTGGRGSLSDPWDQAAALRTVQTLTEAAGDLTRELQTSEQPDEWWDDVRDFRNKLTHEYLSVSTKILWQFIDHDLPVLEQAMGRMTERNARILKR